MKEKKGVREVFAGEEVAFADLISLFLRRKKYLFISVALFFVIGVLVATTSPVEYEAEARILSEAGESTNSSLGGLAGLAGLAGITLPPGGQGEGAGLSPDMYPSIAASEPFLLDLMEERFYFQEKDREMSLFEYFTEERPGHIFKKTFDFLRSIPGRFFALFETRKEWTIPTQALDSVVVDGNARRKNPRVVNTITSSQKFVIDQLEPRIKIEAEGKIITLKVKMPEPYISAQLNNIVLDEVIQYVVAYKTDKQRQNLAFIQEQTNEAEKKFKEAQFRLAAFRDANQGMVSQTAKTREEQLQSEFSLAFNIYNGLVQQLEQTKIQLKKETPLFTEFEPVTVPLNKAEPSIPRILVLYIAFGIFLGGLIIVISIVRDYLKEPVQETGSLTEPETLKI